MAGKDIEKIWRDLTSVNRKITLNGLGVGSIDPYDLEGRSVDWISCMGDLNGVPSVVRRRLELSFTGNDFSPEQYNERMKPILGRREETPPIYRSFESQLHEVPIRKERGG